jgi:hypothetical protein
MRKKGKRMNKAIVIGKLVFTFTYQSMGAPFIDLCGGRTREGGRWQGRAIHLSPWRKNAYGDRMEGKAFCVGMLKG